MTKSRKITRARGDFDSSSSLPLWSGLGAVLAGILFATWGYLHKDIAPASAYAPVRVLGVVVPLLFLLAILGFYVWQKEQLGRLAQAGFACSIVGAALGAVYRVLDMTDLASVAARYAYLVGKGLPPQLLDWFLWLLVGLMLIGVGCMKTNVDRWIGFLPLAMGSFGWVYYVSDVGDLLIVRSAHVLFGMLFSLAWVVLGCLLLQAAAENRTQ